MGNEFNFFQLDSGDISGGQTGGVAAQGRSFDKRMSNFGDLTSTPINVFKAKDELSNQMPIHFNTISDANPLVWGSTVKRVRDDKQIVMMQGAIGIPSADVSTKNNADANLNYYMPNEGWRSFGGKYDTEKTYQGGQLKG